MRRLYLIFLVTVLGTVTALAQDWRDDASGQSQYDCGTVRLLVAKQGDEVYIRLNDKALTVEEFHRRIVPACWTTTPADAVVRETVLAESMFEITVENAVNLRECAGTNCVRIGVAQPGQAFEVIGEDGDWYEIRHEGASAFIAAWLTMRVVDAPKGLLADFQFHSADAKFLLYGHTARTGTWWLNLMRPDGANTDIQIETIVWGGDHTTGFFEHPVIYGWGGNDWELLPELLPNASFYIYLPDDDEIHEFPIFDTPYATNYQIGWNIASRPANIRFGTRIRLIVADRGQADEVKDWAASVTTSEHLRPPGKPQAPTLTAGNGQVEVNIVDPSSGEAPITTYELRYREVGGDVTQIGNVAIGEPYMIEGLTNDETYEVSIAAINRGGKGPYSNWARVTLIGSSG
ncbi:MAG: fibronectin type III domain-containing protein [Chloroflexi bacterium]|nr:fibronectin type III domain-containing protein [Chloroflexota bacterium]